VRGGGASRSGVIDEARALAGRRSAARDRSLDVETGAILVSPRDDACPSWSAIPRARWADRGELQLTAFPRLDEETGSILFPCVPAGRVQLVETKDAREAVVECVVRAGETTEVRWPR
jgi:hypothetical protein